MLLLAQVLPQASQVRTHSSLSTSGASPAVGLPAAFSHPCSTRGQYWQHAVLAATLTKVPTFAFQAPIVFPGPAVSLPSLIEPPLQMYTIQFLEHTVFVS